ncbi:unnamed protein product [Blepharisma stoltei]|uniref:Ribose-5-phosphate isomerase n=1 Tax=Blepharisma stoltei TaxID=1481888 RepID=A0AAU9IA43_9CILI|nr:unnamed protein product [Blepharisma stoltei]
MENIVIAAGSDHAGISLKNRLIEHLQSKGATVIDVGCFDAQMVDYPHYGKAVCDKIIANEAKFGLLVCGTGIGISISANKFPGIRCALCHDLWTAETARKKYDSNVIAIGERQTTYFVAEQMVDAFFTTQFGEEENDVRRRDMIDAAV